MERDRTIPLHLADLEALTELNSGALLATLLQQCADTSRWAPSCQWHNTEVHCRLNTGSFHKHPRPGSLGISMKRHAANKRCHHMIAWRSQRRRCFSKSWPTSASSRPVGHKHMWYRPSPCIAALLPSTIRLTRRSTRNTSLCEQFLSHTQRLTGAAKPG